jgi:hypothetical protein
MEDGSPERVSHVAFSVRLAEPEASVVGALKGPLRGQPRSFGDVGSMSGLPETGDGWAIYKYAP